MSLPWCASFLLTIFGTKAKCIIVRYFIFKAKKTFFLSLSILFCNFFAVSFVRLWLSTHLPTAPRQKQCNFMHKMKKIISFLVHCYFEFIFQFLDECSFCCCVLRGFADRWCYNRFLFVYRKIAATTVSADNNRRPNQLKRCVRNKIKKGNRSYI